LVDNTKARSLADPWVIAHAMHENATVVTKEEKVTALNSNRIKIPNVCENIGLRWINDFQLIEELGHQIHLLADNLMSGRESRTHYYRLSITIRNRWSAYQSECIAHRLIATA
jgi:hypothetical protein